MNKEFTKQIQLRMIEILLNSSPPPPSPPKSINLRMVYWTRFIFTKLIHLILFNVNMFLISIPVFRFWYALPLAIWILEGNPEAKANSNIKKNSLKLGQRRSKLEIQFCSVLTCSIQLYLFKEVFEYFHQWWKMEGDI